jgi:uncharacterized protein (TIGR03067 family)
MLMLKWKAAATLAASCFLGVGALAHFATAARPPEATAQPAADDEAKDKADKDKLKGIWKAISSVDDGHDEKDPEQYQLTFNGDAFIVRKAGQDFFKGTFKLDASASPKTIDLSITEGAHAGGRMRGIYAWDGDTLKWCTSTPQGADRPAEFASEPGSGRLLVVLKKEGP